MAKPKSSAKTKKKSKKTSASPPKRASSRRASPIVLEAADRSGLLRPPTNFDEPIERFARAWLNEGKALRVPDMSPKRLLGLLAKAERAAEKEERTRASLEPRIAAAADERLLAGHAAWRAFIDAWAVTKAQTRSKPELKGAFAFMEDVFKSRSAPRPSPVVAPSEPTDAEG